MLNKKSITNYEILTEEGFKDFTGIKRLKTDKIIEIEFTDGTDYACTVNHEVKMGDEFVLAHHLKAGDILSGKEIKSVKTAVTDEFVYDVLNVEDTSHYITNGITSHNCAFVQGWTEFSASVLPTISSGKNSKLIFTSTPNGLNHFYDYYNGAKKGTNGFKLIEVKWDEVPGRDAQWKQDTLETINHDEQRFNQEYCVTGDTKITFRDKDTGIISEHDIGSIEQL